MQESQLKRIKEIVAMLPDNEAPAKFDTPIHIKKSPHQHLITITAAVATKGEGLCVYDNKDWHEVIPGQANVDYIITSLYQRLKTSPVK